MGGGGVFCLFFVFKFLNLCVNLCECVRVCV